MADRDWPIDDDGDTASPEFRFFFSEMDDGYEFFRRRWVTVKFRGFSATVCDGRGLQLLVREQRFSGFR
ncbi:hypothetical protein U1Q18_020982 [Sarracenia purpurea var. burkii]